MFCCHPSAAPRLDPRLPRATDYQEEEYMLVGMAIKYAGLRGKEVRVVGKTRSTFSEEDKTQ